MADLPEKSNRNKLKNLQQNLNGSKTLYIFAEKVFFSSLLTIFKYTAIPRIKRPIIRRFTQQFVSMPHIRPLS